MKLAVIFGTEVPRSENYYKKDSPDGSSVKSAVWRLPVKYRQGLCEILLPAGASVKLRSLALRRDANLPFTRQLPNNQLNDALTACMDNVLHIEWGA